MSQFVVKVNPDTSAELQRFAFDYGWNWPVDNCTVRLTDKPYLVLWSVSKTILWEKTNSKDHPEITLEYAKTVIINSSCQSCKLNDQYTAKYGGGNTFTVGGTQYPVKLVDDLLEASKGPKIEPCYTEVDPELSAILQEVAFRNRVYWTFGVDTVKYTDYPYLGICMFDDSWILIFETSLSELQSRPNNYGKKVSLKKFLKRLTRKHTNAKITLPTGENVEFKGDKIHVGCQVFDRAALERLDRLTEGRKQAK